MLKKDPNELTWEDVFELEKIAKLIFKEAVESDRDDLAEYVGMLRFYIAMIKGFLLRKGIPPPKRPIIV